jgi:hypothetical protein
VYITAKVKGLAFLAYTKKSSPSKRKENKRPNM